METQRTKTLVAIVLIVAAIFALDRVLPHSMSASALYIVPIMLTLRLSTVRSLAAVTALCITASLVDYLLTPMAVHKQIIWSEELMSLFAQLTTASLVLMQMRSVERERAVYQRAEAEHRRLALVQSVAAATSQTLDLDHVLNSVAASMAALFSANTVAIWLADGSRRKLKPAFYNSASYAEILDRYGAIEWESAPLPLAEAIRTRRIVTVDLGDDTSAEVRGLLGKVSAKTGVAVPLFAHDKVVGAMSLLRNDAQPLSRDDIALVETIGNQVAVAIENARLFSNVNKQRERVTLINDIGQVFASTLELESIYLAIRKRLSEITDCDTLLISLYDSDEQVIRCGFAYTDGEIFTPDKFEPLKLGAGPQSECIRTARPVIVDNIAKHHAGTYRYVGHDPNYPISVIYVPMIAEEKVIGVIQAQSVREGAYTEEDVPLLSIIANLAAGAIQNARLYDDAVRGRQAMEQANRIKEEFLANLSHELRTPLTPILGWVRVLSRLSPDDHEMRAQGLAVLERNAKLQTQLVNDLLDMSRIESGKLSIVAQPTDLNSAVASVIESMRREADDRRVMIETSLALPGPTVMADPARLAQIIGNLLTNAIKFAGEGGRVSISTTCEQDRATITVADTGIGISEEFLPYIFERFRQADSSTRRRHGGLGLGLSIVKSLVDMHGGTIRAQSDGPGRGAAFSVSLPLASMEAEMNAVVRDGGLLGSADEAMGELANLRLLIVEDDRDSLQMMSVLCQPLAIKVTAASTAEEAISVLSRESPDLIISDLTLPGMDGFELARYVRANGRLSQTPMIAITGLASDADRDRALSAGFDAHIPKPVDYGRLFEVARELTRARVVTGG